MTAAFYGGAIVLGALLGAVFIVIWRRCLPRPWARRFWASFTETARGLLTVDETRAFARLYGRLAVSVAAFVGRNTAGLILGCLPTVLALTLAFPVLLEIWGRQATDVVAVPAAATLTLSSATAGDGGVSATDGTGAAVLDAGGRQMTIADPARRHALCWSDGWCLLFELLAFQVERLGGAVLPDHDFIAVRPSHDDANPLWPFLSDLEFAFWLAFLGGTTAVFLVQRRLT